MNKDGFQYLYTFNIFITKLWELASKYIQQVENGGQREVLADRSKPICWDVGLALTCWQVAHFLDNFFRNALRQGMKKVQDADEDRSARMQLFLMFCGDQQPGEVALKGE